MAEVRTRSGSGSLAGRVALITGAGRGIGRATAIAMAGEGARVLVCDKGTSVASSEEADPDVGEATAAEIRQRGGEAVALPVDVADTAAVAEAFAVARNHWGGVDTVVNAAGIIRDRMLWNVDPTEWDDMMSVHLRGTWAVTAELARDLRGRAKEGGIPADVSVATFASSAGVFGNVGSSAYGSAKAGIAGFTRIAAMELAPLGVRVNCVVPFAYTRMADQLPESDPAARSRLARIRSLSVDPVAAFLVWLAACSNASVTGQLFGVRGREVLVFAQPRIEMRIALERTDPEHLSDVLTRWLPDRLPPLQASSEIFGGDPFV